jgi:hypothetical protein
VVTKIVSAIAGCSSDLYELAGAGLLVAGFAVWLGTAAALLTGGVCLLVKAVANDLGEAS